MKRRRYPLCPCGSQEDYETCCGRWHRGEAAPDAEALMRSRYSAYVLQLEPYLLATWHASTRPASLGLDAAGSMKWLGLEVKRHEPTGPDSAMVEFLARYREGGRAGQMQETSRFVHEEGRWYYLDALNVSAAGRPSREEGSS